MVHAAGVSEAGRGQEAHLFPAFDTREKPPASTCEDGEDPNVHLQSVESDHDHDEVEERLDAPCEHRADA